MLYFTTLRVGSILRSRPRSQSAASSLGAPLAVTIRFISFNSNGNNLPPNRPIDPGSTVSRSRFSLTTSNSPLDKTDGNWLKSPKDVAGFLSRHIIGQETAKKILSVAVFNHYHRIIEAQQRAIAMANEHLQRSPPFGLNGSASDGAESGPEVSDVKSEPLRPIMKRKGRTRKSSTEDSMLLVNTSDEEADELTKVVKGDMNEPDPTLVNEMETWRVPYSEAQPTNSPRNDGEAPPTLLGRARKRFLSPFDPPPPLTSTKPLKQQERRSKVVDDEEDLEDVTIEKSNVLMVGPTGSGKTLLAKTLAKILDVPFASSDATSFTQVGYVGDDVESCVARLLRAADYDVSRTEMGIIHIDECDKLARRGTNGDGGGFGTRDVGGEGVQQGLLKLLEGTTISVQAKPPPHLAAQPTSAYTPPSITTGPEGSESTLHRGLGVGPPGSDLGIKRGIREGLPAHGGGSGANNSKGETYMIDTSNILFILSGAFVGLEGVISNRLGKGSIGFGAVLSEHKVSSAEEHEGVQEMEGKRKNRLEGLLATDLVEYGFIPEFIGRLPVLAPLHPLSLNDLVRVLIEPKNALIKQYRKQFVKYSVDLQFSYAAMVAIAKEASKKGGSARNLKSVLEDLLLDAMYETPNASVRYAAVTAAVVRKEIPVLYFSRPQKHLFQEALEQDDRTTQETPNVVTNENETEDEEKITAFG